MKNIFLAVAIGVVTILSSCSNEVDFGEQYKKAVYIVNSKELIYYAQHELSQASKGKISMYVTGTELSESDIRVSYSIDKDALQKYNQSEYGDQTYLYFSLIPENLYKFDDKEVIIKKGEAYGCLNFTINTEALVSDKTYVLPISISKVEGAEVNESSHTILYVIQVQNEYAGDYISTCKENGVGKGQIKKRVQPLSRQKILLPLASKSNVNASDPLDNSVDFYQVMIKSDNSLTVEPYLKSVIYPNTAKKSYYDPQEHIFYIYYKIEDKYGELIPVEEILKMI